MFKNKVAVITGGAHGIGKATAEAFKKQGARVFVIDITDGDHFVGDISKKETLERFVGYVLENCDGVDYLINNAPPAMKGIDSCSYEEFQTALSVGVTAPFYLTKLLLPAFKKDAAVINISSTRSSMSQPQTESYTASKGGISALTHAMAVSLAGRVRVCSISPGWIDTYGNTFSGADALQHPSARVGEPDDIARTVLFLCSPDASFINGEDIKVDGGMTKLMVYHNDFGWKLEE